MVMSTILHETQTLSPALLFAQYMHCSEILLEASENYQKRSWRNKYRILAANGPMNLSIPLKKGKNNQKPIKETEISYDELWVTNHINTITSAYSSAPYFDFYSVEVFSLLKNRFRYLYDLNKELLKWSMQILSISIPIMETHNFCHLYEERNIKDWRNTNMLKIQNLENSPTYPQVFEEKFGFISNLSILDCIFCLGPETTLWLKKLYKWHDKRKC